jgi:hypothetical protein
VDARHIAEFLVRLQLPLHPIRNWVRVLLGALMGVVVGLFSGISHQISLPPLAVAFLAGYGVEAVFSIFDGFITRMRQPSASEK